MRVHEKLFEHRFLAMLLIIVMMISWIPANVFATVEYSNGTLEALTTGAIPAGDATNPKLVYDAVELEWVDVDDSIGRTKAGWYIGMRVHAPAEMTKETDFIDGDIQVTFQTQGRSGWSASANFWENQNSDSDAAETARYIDLWYYIDEERVHEAKVNGKLTFGFQVDWDMDTTFDQVFTMEIDPENVVLNKDGTKVFPAVNSAVVSILNNDGSINNDGTISGNGTDYVKVTPGATVYEWVAAENIRPSDGWWAGIRIDVPQSVDYENAKFKLGSTEYHVKDETETDADGKEFVPVWKSLSKLADGQDLSATKIELDWDGNGVYEQIVEFSINPANVTLMKDGENIYPGPETVTVTINKTGNGTVKVDGVEVSGSSVEVEKDKSVEIEVIAANGSYIKALTVDGTTKTVTKGESYSENVSFDDAASIDVTFMEEYKVEVSANDGGTVKLDSAEVAIKTVDVGTKVDLTVTAAEGYQIQSINIGGVVQTIADVENFSKEITVDADVAVSVVFVKVYKITVSYGEDGSIKVDGNDVLTGGTVVVKEGTDTTTTATLVATPAEGFRVSAVVINDVSQNFDEHAYVHTEILEMNKDYVVTVTFAQSIYDVTINETENGTVKIDAEDGKVNHNGSVIVTVSSDEGYEIEAVTVNGIAVEVDENGQFTISNINEAKTIAATFVLKKYDVTVAPTQNGKVTTNAEDGKVEHGSNVVVTIEPAEGYSIGTVMVNDVVVSILTEETDEKATFTITEAKEVQTIKVTFVETEVASSTITDLFNDEDAVRADGMLYIYKNDGKITFTTDKDGIQIYVDGERDPLGGENTKTVTIEETTVITKIQLRYKAECEMQTRWHDVLGFENGAKLSLVVDTTDPTATIDPADANANGYYKENFDVDVEFADPDNGGNNITNDYSGVASAKWWIENAGNKTQEGSFTVTDGQGTIPVDAALNNSDNVVVYVEVTDKAGNTKTYNSDTLKINCTAPVLESVLVVEETKKDEAEAGYYTKRVIKLTITDRATTFDKAAATNGIKITAKNYAGTTLTVSPSVISWDSTGNTHIATIEFTMDAIYEWEISYTNLADMKMVTTSTVTNVTDTYQFTVDITSPTGKIKYTEENGWEKLLEELTFGIWSNNSMTVTAVASDDTSGVKEITYYKSNTTSALTWGELENLEFEDCNGYTVDVEDEKFTVYARIVDKAGNVNYISTNGMVFDKTESWITISPEEPNENGLYNGDVKVEISVTEILTEGADYSGIKTIDYKIVKNGDEKNPTQSGNLYTFNSKNPKYEDLKSTWSTQELNGTEDYITVDAKLNNSNNVVIIVTVVDNAGNEYTASCSLSIDITAPQIDISYDNNNNDSGSYYNDNRVASIKITERNFDAKDVKIIITNTDGTIPSIPAKISDWVKTEGSEINGDDTTYTATITYAADGDYEFSIEYTDLAGWTCGNVEGKNYDQNVAYADGTQNPTAFTIDQTAPVVTVSYNNNSAQNDKYFNATRTATITITEHNFPLNDIARVVFTQATDRGGVIPTVTWAHDGDTHIATIEYTVDGDYTFDVTMKDLAGNGSGAADYGTTVAGKDFIIDTTFENMISQEGVENGVAYGYGTKVIPNIQISDINLQEYTVTLTGVQKDKTIDLTAKANALLSVGTETVTGILDLFSEMQELDGIYTLKMVSKDKAGNEDSMEIVFTVNRYGSVYEYDQYLMDLIADGGSYVFSINEDLIITEYNADKLISGSLKIEITVDGKPLENVVFTVTPEINESVEIGSSGWYQYKYTISKDNFTADGVYKIYVSSEDATGNTPENSNYEDMTMSFRVDSTQAEITSIVGLEEAIINAQSVTVQYTIFDTIGLKSIKIYVDGQMIDEITDFSADMNNYEGQFVLNEQSAAQSVRIVVEDMSGNITDTSDDDFTSAYEFNNSVTVSTNMFVRWYADKLLFWGSIAGVVVLAVGIIFFVAAKRKKKEEEETAAK